MPRFETIAKFAAPGCLVKPLLVDFLTSQEAFRLTIRTGKPLERPPDGWFHPSAHPGMTEDQLLGYLTMPPREKLEDFGYIGRMSVLFGTIWGEVVRQALIQLRLMVPVRDGTCLACGYPQPRHCREHGARSDLTRSTGHLDGILRFGPPDDGWSYLSADIWGFECKTIKNFRLGDAPDMDEAYFRERWPDYWWQVQEYMRLTGLGKYIVLFFGIGNPWDLREYHVYADPVAAYSIERKYLGALRRAGITS
jgi:hypothetical protein